MLRSVDAGMSVRDATKAAGRDWGEFRKLHKITKENFQQFSLLSAKGGDVKIAEQQSGDSASAAGGASAPVESRAQKRARLEQETAATRRAERDADIQSAAKRAKIRTGLDCAKSLAERYGIRADQHVVQGGAESDDGMDVDWQASMKRQRSGESTEEGVNPKRSRREVLAMLIQKEMSAEEDVRRAVLRAHAFVTKVKPKDTKKGPDKELWDASRQKELDGLLRLKVWEEVAESEIPGGGTGLTYGVAVRY